MKQPGHSYFGEISLCLERWRGKYWETRLMCGGVYEDELKDEADTVIAQHPITNAPEGLSKPEEDDGYYYPGSDPQE